MNFRTAITVQAIITLVLFGLLIANFWTQVAIKRRMEEMRQLREWIEQHPSPSPAPQTPNVNAPGYHETLARYKRA